MASWQWRKVFTGLEQFVLLVQPGQDCEAKGIRNQAVLSEGIGSLLEPLARGDGEQLLQDSCSHRAVRPGPEMHVQYACGTDSHKDQ